MQGNEGNIARPKVEAKEQAEKNASGLCRKTKEQGTSEGALLAKLRGKLFIAAAAAKPTRHGRNLGALWINLWPPVRIVCISAR